ncbi:MAG: hypothetical protein PHW62_01320 [Candidatus Ratteibacteria bacterium]|nr:hypothetical protein [Candidatus Ratteibacteria bacterium]
MKKILFGAFWVVVIWGVGYGLGSLSFTSEHIQTQNSKIAGEIFSVPVPMENYYFAWGVIQVFGTRWRGVPQTTEETEEQVWVELVLSYEAFQRDIKIERKEVEDEVAKILSGQEVPFNWKDNKQEYEKWVKDNINMPVVLFENQIEHLLKIEKLRKQVMDSISPEVTEEEAIQEFRNEHNTLSVELIQFDELDKADDYYNKVKGNPAFWDEEKEKNPDSFKRPGFVALEFLMHMWKFPKEDVYKMLELKVGEIYPPAPIYQGYGVFKILEIRRAMDEDFPKYRNSYYEQVKMQKKYEGFQQWLKNLKDKANIKIYIKLKELFPKE